MRHLLFISILSLLGNCTYSQFQDSLQEVVVTANREAVKRSEAPISIASIGTKMIKDARATSADQLLNKVSGVNMVSLGNEQHQMSIRQPITTKSLFLYLQDGIPIRTSGLFNHNALLEINMSSVKNIEVIKGPSSSLYGSEAIGGVVNFITQPPADTFELRVSLQGNNIGYRRSDLSTGFTVGKLGVTVAGYFADKKNGYIPYTDFNKSTGSIRSDYRISERTMLSNSFNITDYYSDMPGGIDSLMFAARKFTNVHTFTYRKVFAIRNHTTLTHNWSDASRSTVSAVFRKNNIGQNPAYRIKDDFRKQNGEWRGRKELAHGEINESSFNSYALVAQHRQLLRPLKAAVITGFSVDVSPSEYSSNYISIKKDTNTKKYIDYSNTDSLLSKYSTNINNYAGFVNFEFSPVKKMRIVASLRYDYFRYNFRNTLSASSFSGCSDTINSFSKISSKIGATYNFTSRTGIYANYSEGFIPPQVTEMYTGVKVPDLVPSVTRSYEAGGWIELLRRKILLDISLYSANSDNEVISVRMDDGSFANQNAGQTSHKGVEFGVNAKPLKSVSLRFSGAYNEHRFVKYSEKGENYSGRQMNGAPRWLINTEVWYAPPFIPGLRTGVELQHVGKYFMDAQNSASYTGYTVVNIRANYEYKWLEFWVNALNATDRYYATNVSKSSFGQSYTLADRININVGCTYNLGKLMKQLTDEQ